MELRRNFNGPASEREVRDKKYVRYQSHGSTPAAPQIGIGGSKPVAPNKRPSVGQNVTRSRLSSTKTIYPLSCYRLVGVQIVPWTPGYARLKNVRKCKFIEFEKMYGFAYQQS